MCVVVSEISRKYDWQLTCADRHGYWDPLRLYGNRIRLKGKRWVMYIVVWLECLFFCEAAGDLFNVNNDIHWIAGED